MKISLSEFIRFQTQHANDAEASKWLRFGQAWFNYFNLQKHTPANDAERMLLDRIYNETSKRKAYRAIMDNFIDPEN